MINKLNQNPSLGIVIPCNNNSWQLSLIFSSIKLQTERPDEVIIIDDNSSTYEQSEIETLCKINGTKYKRLTIPIKSREKLGRRSHARNLGTKSLNTDIVLYLDGDMLLSPNYIKAIKNYHSKYDRIYLRAQRYNISTKYVDKGINFCLRAIKNNDIPWRNNIFSYGPIFSWYFKTNTYHDKWEWSASNNLSVRKKYVVSIDYWDENFYGWGEEDIDFSFRLFQLGLTPIFTNITASHHLEHPIDEEINRSTLINNAEYILNKFPQIVNNRIDAYRNYSITIGDILK